MSNISPITAVNPHPPTSSINRQSAAAAQPVPVAESSVVSEPMTVRRIPVTTQADTVQETILQGTTTPIPPMLPTQTARDVQTVLAAQTIMSIPVPGTVSQPFRQSAVLVEPIDALTSVNETGSMFTSSEQAGPEHKNPHAGEDKTFMTNENMKRNITDKYIDIAL